MAWVATFAIRTSLTNCVVGVSTCAMAGMMSALAGGASFGVGCTGLTRLTETGTEAIVPPPDDVTFTVPVFDPNGSPVEVAVTVIVVPVGGSVPLEGDALRNGAVVETL